MMTSMVIANQRTDYRHSLVNVSKKPIPRSSTVILIKKFGGKTTSAVINEFMAKLEGKPVEEVASEDEGKGDSFAAFNAVLTKTKALICSRGRHGGEISAKGLKLPCVSSCVGATDRIASGQTIVVDADRGEVYDASLLQKLH